MRILIAIDGSPCSAKAVQQVAESGWPKGSEVKVLSVIEPIVIPIPEAVAMPESCYDVMCREARKEVDRAASLIRRSSPNLKLETAVSFGNAEEVILDEAESWEANLIVVGSHGRGMAGRLMLGSVSHAVALHAKCSVEIVRDRSANIPKAQSPDNRQSAFS